MPNIDFLYILPLLGGYVFLTTFYLTKFQHSRIETQRLIFNSIISALIMLFLAYYFDKIILQNCLICVRNFGKNLIPFEVVNFNLFLFTLIFSYCFAKFLNKVIPERLLTWYVIDRWGNEFEKLYLDSMGSEEFSKKLLMITTESGKVYVGYILRITKPLLSQQIELVPIISGYRREDNKIVRFTTPYAYTYDKISSNYGIDFAEEETAIVLPKEKIISVSKFYPFVYLEFQNSISEIRQNQNLIEK